MIAIRGKNSIGLKKLCDEIKRVSVDWEIRASQEESRDGRKISLM